MSCFVDWLTDERRSALFPSGAIVEDSHQCNPEVTNRVVLYKELFLKIPQYLQENTCVGVSF